MFSMRKRRRGGGRSSIGGAWEGLEHGGGDGNGVNVHDLYEEE